MTTGASKSEVRYSREALERIGRAIRSSRAKSVLLRKQYEERKAKAAAEAIATNPIVGSGGAVLSHTMSSKKLEEMALSGRLGSLLSTPKMRSHSGVSHIITTKLDDQEVFPIGLGSAVMLHAAMGNDLQGTWIEKVYLGVPGATVEAIRAAALQGATPSVTFRVAIGE